MQTKDIKDYLQDLNELINIESPTSSKEGIAKVADFFIQKAKALNLDSKKISTDNYGDFVVISNNFEVKNYDIAFLGHMDTVYPIGHINKAPFIIEKDKVKGPGVIDNKGCSLAIFYALKYLDLSKFSFVIILNSNEEVGSMETGIKIQEFLKKSRLCFVVEPARSNGNLVGARKGAIKYSLKFEGISAHSGEAFSKGKSAMVEAAHYICFFSKLNDTNLEHSFNSIVTNGGNTVNTIPGYAEIQLEMRYLKQKSLDLLEERLNYLCLNPFAEGIKVTREIIDHFEPLFNESNKALEIQELIIQEAEKLGMQGINWETSGGGSDGSLASALGVLTFDGLGVVGDNMHSEKEYLDINSIVPRINLLINSVQKLVIEKIIDIN